MNQDTNRAASWREELRKSRSVRERTAIPRVAMPQLDPDYRIACNEEVNRGLTREMAVLEAARCLDCPDPQCMTGCPVGIHIPAFIKNIERGDEAGAYRVLRMTSALPAVCGRVCPQEKQCESKCIYHKMGKAPVAIGYLERYAADCAADVAENTAAVSSGPKIAVAGSGPAGLAFAGEMASYGYRVTVFEALHRVGGVLIYGIPEFRLPNSVVEREIESLRRQGVEFVTDCIVGKTLSHDQLREMGFEGIFVGSGAGLPRFMGIPGENYIGVMSSNEYLTRINLMGAGQEGEDTPVLKGRSVAVIGGGNTAMDSCRTARRQGAERVMIVYRRGEAEMPARIEEVEHAKEEGVEFLTLCNPVEYLADENGRVCRMRIQRMELGEPDASGRRSPVPVEGAIEEIPADMVIVSVGVSPNPIIPNAFAGLEVSRRGTIEVDGETMRSSMPDIWAGGDIVRGGATVILAMGDGRRAARAMHAALSARKTERF
ncbi:MAG: NADPH-dependent glutamate synthase [Duncaniella sp.]|nr:NADPH-dependent glutamate synthase [Duncaniella sp.]